MGHNNCVFRNLKLSVSLFKKSLRKTWVNHQTIRKCSDSPVKYSTSKAAVWKAEYSRRGIPKEDDSPWFQPYVVSASVAVFLIYFCVVREENDLDDILSTSLYDRIDGLEQAQLRTILKYNQERGIGTENIKRRLEELQK